MSSFPVASQCHQQLGTLNSCTMSTSSTTHPRSRNVLYPICLCSCSVAVHRRWALTFCETLCVSSGEDAVLAEGAFPSQEVTGRLDK